MDHRPAPRPAMWAAPRADRSLALARSTSRPDGVGLELHQHGVVGGAAVGEHRPHPADLPLDLGDDVLDLEHDRLQRGPGELLGPGAEGETGEQGGGSVVPPGRAEASERRHEQHAVAAVGGAGRQRCRRGAEQVGEPHQRRTGGPDVPFEREARLVGLPGQGARQPRRADVHPVGQSHHRGPGAVGRLDLPGPPPGVGEQRRVRVAEDTSDGSRRGQGVQAARGREGPGGGHHAWQSLGGNPKPVEQPRVPGPASQVQQLRTRRVAGLDDVLTGQAPEQPGIDRAQAQLAGPAAATVGVVGVEQPGGLRRGEHRVQREAADLADALTVAGGADLIAQVGAPAVLPAEQGSDRTTGRPLPQQRRLALGTQPHREDAGGVVAAQAGRDGTPYGCPDLLGVLLGPPWPGM